MKAMTFRAVRYPQPFIVETGNGQTARLNRGETAVINKRSSNDTDLAWSQFCRIKSPGRIVGYASLCPAPRDAYGQESGTAVIRPDKRKQFAHAVAVVGF